MRIYDSTYELKMGRSESCAHKSSYQSISIKSEKLSAFIEICKIVSNCMHNILYLHVHFSKLPVQKNLSEAPLTKFTS